MKKRILIIILISLITISSVLAAIFVFSDSYKRFWEALCDLWESVKYYFVTVFNLDIDITPTVQDTSNVIQWDNPFPQEQETFFKNAQEYIDLLFNEHNFRMWLYQLGTDIEVWARLATLIIPVLMLIWIVIKNAYFKPKLKHDEDTVPLRIFKACSKVTFEPIFRFIKDFVSFIKAHAFIWKTWLAVWLFNLNLVSIIVAFISFYFYFAVSFDFGAIYSQFVKLFIDLQIIWKYVTWWNMTIILYIIVDILRKKIARQRLQHYEARNCGFINELPIVSMSCGSMGKKKTTLITDMALSQQVMFRQKAFEILKNCDMKFPRFPWILFEDDIKLKMEDGTVYNLATIKEWVEDKKNEFSSNHTDPSILYNYDWRRYGHDFNDALTVSNLFDVLNTYAQAYFIYVIESSIIVSNYAIRDDSELVGYGNFPMWSSNFFPRGITEGHYSKILDFDTLRLGKKVIADNPNAGSFEFGVIVISEIGKERGNNLELREVKRGTEETNQKNDLFNSWLKMCRHSATVDHYPFVKVFTDEQRPESWGADARDLCDILNIASSGELKLAMPFYTIEDMVSEWAFNKFVNLYYDLRFVRGDNTLLIHILKKAACFLWRRNLRIYNNYGYSVLKIEKERGTMDGKIERKKYFLMNKKIYSKRFSTDCFSDYFNDLAKKAKVGLMDYLEYENTKATVDELKLQNSYFINALYQNAGSN